MTLLVVKLQEEDGVMLFQRRGGRDLVSREESKQAPNEPTNTPRLGHLLLPTIHAA